MTNKLPEKPRLVTKAPVRRTAVMGAAATVLIAATPSLHAGVPAEQATSCADKAAVQDYAGHGTHVGSTVAAPINGIGISGVAPKATLVGLHAGTANGYFFTQPA